MAEEARADRAQVEDDTRKREFEYALAGGEAVTVHKLSFNQIRDLNRKMRELVPKDEQGKALERLAAGDIGAMSLDLVLEVVAKAVNKAPSEVGEWDADDVIGIGAKLLEAHLVDNDAVMGFFEIAAPVLSMLFPGAAAAMNAASAGSKTNAGSAG